MRTRTNIRRIRSLTSCACLPKIQKKHRDNQTEFSEQPGPISIRDPLKAPLPEKSRATVAIRPFGSVIKATNGAKQRKSGAWR
jgi:hypothetical protein